MAGTEISALREEIKKLTLRLAQLESVEEASAREGEVWVGNLHSNQEGWQSVGHCLSREQVERYSRHLILPSFGVAAQDRLCKSGVLIVGAGGLGSPCALYLAAAGIGRLGIVDRDCVELSNLHRQIIHQEAFVGQHKCRSAARACRALNSTTQVVTYPEGMSPANAQALVREYEVVVDASDNAPTRYLLNDACAVEGRPLVSGAALGTEGQLTVYGGGDNGIGAGPCYRCLFPEAPQAGACSSCSDAGVLGVVPGIIGTLQALEAIKLASGVGNPLVGRMLLLEALSLRLTTIKLRARSPSCAACGHNPTITADTLASYDYTAFTGQAPIEEGPPPCKLLPRSQRLGAQDLSKALSEGRPCLLLDVRPPHHFSMAHIPGSVNIPYDDARPEGFSLGAVQALIRDRRGPVAESIEGGRDAAAGASHPGSTPHDGGEAVPRSGQGRGANGHAEHVEGRGWMGAQGKREGEGKEEPEGGGRKESMLGVGPGGAAEGGTRTSEESSQVFPVFVVCRRGNDSQRAVHLLRQTGFEGAVDLVGGLQAWAREVDPRFPLY